MLAHHALALDWRNISLATVTDAEWLVRSALCVIDSSQQTNATGSCVLFVKGISAWILANHYTAKSVAMKKFSIFPYSCPKNYSGYSFTLILSRTHEVTFKSTDLLLKLATYWAKITEGIMQISWYIAEGILWDVKSKHGLKPKKVIYILT